MDELCRVLKNDGRIVIIDKNLKKLGKLVITDFEQWFESEAVRSYLEKNCYSVQTREIGYESQIADGLFLSWAGIKKSNMLDRTEWHSAMIGETPSGEIVDRIKSNAFPAWSRPLLQRTSPGDSMLELGSGTGELSAILGMYSRIPILLDFSRKNIDFSREVFEKLVIKVHLICADVLIGLPFATGSVDWVWSSGLLEHFSDEQIIGILKESMRVSRKGVISLVPNASSIPYRIGKHRKEKNGNWPYGREIPKFSMKELFKEAGLANIHEHSVGSHHALTFLDDHNAVRALYEEIGLQEVQKMNQGYLLFTVGEKIGRSGES
jgi:ubiquinone/menaquinone biosynthesis C-methylase UbiE